MITLSVIAIIFLGWSLGRNNLCNLFGVALGTRMVSFRKAVILSICFLFLGVFISGYGTLETVTSFASLTNIQDAFTVTLSAGLVLYGLTYLKIPVSITQTSLGAMIGFGIYQGADLPMDLVRQTVSAWFYIPILAGVIGFLFFKGVKVYLRIHPIGILYRDQYVRFSLIVAGCFAAYAVGANNIAGIAGPFVDSDIMPSVFLMFLVAVSVSLGFFQADRRVIQTISRDLFPLSPIEALIAVFTGAFILFLFSSEQISSFLEGLSLPSFPLVPVPLSNVVVGSIVGISFAKGGYGLKTQILGVIVLSWILAPLLSGLICYGVLTILGGGENYYAV